MNNAGVYNTHRLLPIDPEDDDMEQAFTRGLLRPLELDPHPVCLAGNSQLHSCVPITKFVCVQK